MYFRTVSFERVYENVFSKTKVDNILAKGTGLQNIVQIILNIDGASVVSRSHSPITLANLSFINLVSISSEKNCIGHHGHDFPVTGKIT